MSAAEAVHTTANASSWETPVLLVRRKCACGGSSGFNWECKECKRKRLLGNPLQRKLAINEPGDGYEIEADRVAEQVMYMPEGPVDGKTASSQSVPFVQRRLNSTRATGIGTAPPIVHEVLASPGRPLDAATRAFFEPRLFHDFSNVRVHADSKAAESAQAVAAHAYTVGEHIGFAAERFNPGTHEGRRLIAHELAHVVQQSSSAAGYPSQTQSIHRKLFRKSTSEAKPSKDEQILTQAGANFDELWRRFVRERDEGSEVVEPDLRIMIVRMIQEKKVIEYGPDLITWLMNNDEIRLGREVASRLAREVQGLAGSGGRLPNWLPGGIGSAPQKLIAKAKREAHRGQHDSAISFFGSAYSLLLLQLAQRSNRLAVELRKAGTGAVELDNMIREYELQLGYSELSSLYDQIREIIGFYPSLERRVRAENPSLANEYRERGRRLIKALLDKYSLDFQDPDKYDFAVTMVATIEAESSGYRLHGARGNEEVVHPLPGTPTQDTLGEAPFYHQSLGSVTERIYAQDALISHLYENPEIQKRFPSGEIDLSSNTNRRFIWGTLYNDSENPSLEELLRLVERYQKAFTFHTVYDIRDSGVNYLTSEFPEDLMGRVVRDCGVYALTVAYDVFQVAKDVGLDLNFEIYVMPDHAALLIEDNSNEDLYVVNNDDIVGPFTDDPFSTISELYGGTVGRKHSVFPAYRSDIGSTTSMGEKEFRDRSWQTFMNVHKWGVVADAPDGDRTKQELIEDAYKRYYNGVKIFDELTSELDAGLDDLAQLDGEEQKDAMVNRVPELLKKADSAKFFFIYSGPAAPFGLTAEARKPLPEMLFMFSTTATEVHPLARMAQALLYFEAIGGVLSPDQISWINWPCGPVEGTTEIPGVNSLCTPILKYRSEIDTAKDDGKPLPVF